MANAYPPSHPGRPGPYSAHSRNEGRPRPVVRRNEPYEERNDPLPPKDPAQAKPKPHFTKLTESEVFATKRFGGLIIRFTEADGEAVKPKSAHGYLTIKPKGQAPMTGYFCLEGDGRALESLPEKRAFVRLLEASYKPPKEAKLIHIHYQPH